MGSFCGPLPTGSLSVYFRLRTDQSLVNAWLAENKRDENWWFLIVLLAISAM